eukprot:gene10043-13440_t
MFRGTLTQTSVYPREVVKRALHHQACAVVLAHNHPSGSVQPSRADEMLTHTLKAALALVDVRVLDHIIVSQGQSLSMAEQGLAVALSDLAGIKKQLAEAAAAQAAEAARAAAEAQRLAAQKNLFENAVGKVQRLPDPGLADISPQRPPPHPLQHQRDEAAALRESMSDEFDISSLLDTDAQLSFRRP